MEAALLPDERTDLVSMNRLGHGWAYQKLANQQAIFRAGCKDGCDLGCDWLPDYELQPICGDQSGAVNSMIKRPNSASISSVLLGVNTLYFLQTLSIHHFRIIITQNVSLCAKFPLIERNLPFMPPWMRYRDALSRSCWLPSVCSCFSVALGKHLRQLAILFCNSN